MNSLCLWEVMNLTEPGCAQGRLTNLGQPGRLRQKLPAGLGYPKPFFPKIFPTLRSPENRKGPYSADSSVRSSRGKALAFSGLIARGEPTPTPIPQVRDGGHSGGGGNRSEALVLVHLQVLSRHPACSLFLIPLPLLAPLPTRVSTGLRGQTLGCPRGHGLLTGLALSMGAATFLVPARSLGTSGLSPVCGHHEGPGSDSASATLPVHRAAAGPALPGCHSPAVSPGPASPRCPQSCEAVSARGQGRALSPLALEAPF